MPYMKRELFGLIRAEMKSKIPKILFGVFIFSLVSNTFGQNSSALVEYLPESASGISSKKIAVAKSEMISSANSFISDAGIQILNRGGNAVDAAVASAIMVTLVEPQSAGIGGGGFILYFNRQLQLLTSFDGRETAPSGANENLFLDENREPLTYAQAVSNGNSVGVPGLLKALEMMHKKHGKLPWKDLFQPTIELAEKGFQISPRLFKLVQSDPFLRQSDQGKKYFYDQYGNPRAVGTVLKNPDLANVLREISTKGVTTFYEGNIAKDMVSAVRAHPKPGKLVIDDLKNYQAKERPVICGPYRSWKICGMGPPSSGGITTLQILGILEKENLSGLEPNSVPAIHIFSEAGRLAFADRDLYIADPDFIKVPFQEMLDPFYLSQRRNLIDENRSMGIAKAGVLLSQKVKLEVDNSIEIPSTSHISIVDKKGNAISMTLSVAAAFGSRIMTDGFFLNNEITDFSFLSEKDGKKVLNRVQANKRPRSAMSPTFVFDQNNKLYMVIGSAGGPAIINYVAKAIIGVVDWHLDIQSAVALPNFGSRNQETDIEMNRIPRNTISQLEKMNHSIKEWEMTSGTNAIVIDEFGGLWGGVDPRREGLAIGH